MALEWIERKLPAHPIARWAIALNLLVLTGLYYEWLLGHLGKVAWLFFVIWLPFAYFNMFFLFFQYHLSLAIFASCLGLMVAALIWAHPRSLAKSSFVLFLLAYAAWPLTVQKYEPAIEPLPGVDMQLVTDTGYFGSAIKRKLRRNEGKTCDYDLLGWSESNVLYYESNCFGKTLWAYDPISGQNLSLSRIPAETELKPAGSGSISGHKIARSTIYGSDNISLYVDGVATSPDRQWIAIESKHIYSVHDVVVFKRP